MKVSAALIVKNEEENLPRLLTSIEGKFDEIVVVDTGSTDRTIEIAKEFGCKVYEKEWNGFADARNYAISKCSGDWIWHFDADFELEEEEYKKFLQIIRNLQNSDVEALTIYINNYNSAGIVSGISSQTFIHKNLEYIRWHGNIHETLDVSLAPIVPIYVNHYGYQDEEISYKKALRNLTLIHRDLEDAKRKQKKKDVLVKLFYLFQSYAVLAHYTNNIEEKWENAIVEFLSLRQDFVNHENLHFFANYTLLYIADIYYVRKDYEEALHFLNLALDDKFLHPDFLYLKTKILYAKGKKKESAITFIECLKSLEKFEKHKDPSGVIDNMEKIWKFLLNAVDMGLYDKQDFPAIYELWKKNRSLYFGILLLEITKRYDDTNYLKLRKKTEKLFYKNERALLYFLHNAVDDTNRLALAKATVSVNPKNAYANKILAQHYYDKGLFEKALHHFFYIPNKDVLFDVLPQFIDALKRCGYKKEAKKLLESLKN